MLNAFFTQPVIDVAEDSKVVQTGLLTKVYDYSNSKWRVPKDLKVSMRTQLKVIDSFKNRSKLGRIGLMISLEDFVNERVLEVLKQYLREHQDIDGFTVEIIDFDTLENMEIFKKMTAQYRAVKIKIVVTNISDKLLERRLESGLKAVDGIKYAMQNERLEETNQATFQNAAKWAEVARKYNINFILDGVETSKDVQFAREELNIRYLQGYYFGIPDLPVLT
jgi:EAL domain-containing protein (putative c-di-GMP-specific phosphodiesterase class I)